MNKLRISCLAAAALIAASPQLALAQDAYPMEPAEYVEVAAIHIDDGYGLKYAQHLATVWRASQDYAVKQGWITGYEVLVNTHAREGEPNLYLLTRFEKFETPEEQEARGRQFRAQMGRTIAQMQEESAGRAEYRTLGGEMLLRRMKWRD
ncbi:hypothetical protein G6N82_11910 [Altererythrobacter sp. BO-6]|uniref:hypothetical protein n=1 Tax=Altererythrobacter sp. BO-6 TaxID=2604537 RepID=UPI0013E1EC87|nr:hypothetical protein [Altererythrobacter sp. BO-6]QIG54767.1 hypothetical protein G6N82_11910 [Altererythrobacter sp. BO-6]